MAARTSSKSAATAGCAAWSRATTAPSPRRTSIWAEPRELPEGCARLADTMVTRGRISITDIWQRVRILFEARPDHRREDDARLPARRTNRPTSARSPKRRAGRSACCERCRRASSGARRARSRCSPRCAMRARIPRRAAGCCAGRLGERLPEREARYLWGRVALEGARAAPPDALALVRARRRCAARRRAARVESARRAARRRMAARCARRSTACRRRSARSRPGPTGTAARSPRRATRLARAPTSCASPASPSSTACSPNEELGQANAAPRESYSPSEEELEAAQRDPGLARALELIRLGLRNEGVREWQFAIRFFDDPQLHRRRRARAPRRGLRPRHPHRRPHRAPAQLRAALPGALPRRVQRVRQEPRPRRGLGARPGAPGKPLRQRRALERRRRRLMQVMPRTARYVASRIGMRNYRAKSVTEVQTNVNARHRLSEAGARSARPPGARLGGLQRRSRPRRALARSREPLEGAIYAETIPFGETRDYVKKVMANSVFYAAADARRSRSRSSSGSAPSRRAASATAQDDELP